MHYRPPGVRRLMVAAIVSSLVLAGCDGGDGGGDEGRGDIDRPRPTMDATPLTSAPVPASTTPILTDPATPRPLRGAERPNVLVITLDDAAMKEQPYLPMANRLIGDAGLTMETAITPTPICGPSRASLLTGEYAHNHGVVSIGKGSGAELMAGEADNDTLPVWLEDAGYDTLFLGKYINGYTEADIDYTPPGWTTWRPFLDPTTYSFTNPTMLVDGSPVETNTYSTTLLADQTRELITDPVREDKPWFLWLNYVAPHYGGPADDDDPDWEDDPAPVRTTRPDAVDRDTYADVPNFSGPEMFEDDPTDKTLTLGAYNDWSAAGRDHLKEARQQRLEALRAVDRGIADTFDALRETGQLDNTYVILHSDNGYALGEHNLVSKNHYFHDVIQVPMMMRGPGLPAGTTVTAPVTVADLAPTIAALTGATPGPDLDGVDLTPWLLSRATRRVVPISAYPVEGGDASRPIYTGLIVGPWTYVQGKGGREELYNRTSDPSELYNLRRDRRFRKQLHELRKLNDQVETCVGTQCPQEFLR